MKVKVCGITNLEDSLLAVKLGADSIGFIFYKKSKRYVSPEVAGEIIQNLPPFVSTVGVFVNENFTVVNHIGKELSLDYIQLHGDENIEYINKIDGSVIKAIRIKDKSSLKQINNYSGTNILLDAYSDKEYGGTGNSFNWDLVKNIDHTYILSGGINIDNLDFIYKKIKPVAIDLSSSLEKEPGKKDKIKMIKFFNKLNRLRYDADINEFEFDKR